MNTQKKKGLYLMLAGAVVLLGALLFVYVGGGTTPSGQVATSTATSTAPSTSIWDMEPIIPEAKVSTEGWKTCRNEEYGWEIKYPGEWYVYGFDSERNPHTTGYTSPSGNCVGAMVLILQHMDPGDDEMESISLEARDDFAYSKYFNLERKDYNDIPLLSHLKDVFTLQDRPFGTALISGLDAIYEKISSNSMKGGYTLSVFVEHPQRGVMKISFSNMGTETFQTALSTIRFSTSTGELAWGSSDE